MARASDLVTGLSPTINKSLSIAKQLYLAQLEPFSITLHGPVMTVTILLKRLLNCQLSQSASSFIKKYSENKLRRKLSYRKDSKYNRTSMARTPLEP